MSFFGKFKPGSAPGDQASKSAVAAKKDPNAPQPTPLEKHLADVTGPVRNDGSDKFFGFENYGSTCYCNSIIQCLYYSAPFREHVLNFPSKDFLEKIHNGLPPLDTTADTKSPNGAPLSPNSATTPYPNPTSPARKPLPPASPGPGASTKPEDQKDSPEYRKKLALAAGPVLDMTYNNAKKYGMDETLFTALKDIFEAILGHQSRIGVVSPHKFLEILRRENEMFRSAMHQDAHEFLNLLLNQVVDNVELFGKQHPELKQQLEANGAPPEEQKDFATAMSKAIAGSRATTNASNTDWVHDLFEGTLTSETRCLTCENTSQRDEAFLDLSVDLAAHSSVTSCLRKFSEEEMLCERNKFHCDNCGGLQEAEKRMKIKRLPRILALHLKRFKYTEDLQRLQKLFHRVVYPFHLRLFNTTDDAEDSDRLYELYAVVVHIGGGPYHGHYVSIIKTQDRGWLLFDDELVEPVSKDYVLNFFGGEPIPAQQDARQLACAYVLFYQETTLEAVLKEQDSEGQQPEGRASDVGTMQNDGAIAAKNGLQPSYTAATPIAEELDHMDPLAHAQTAPQLHPIAEATHRPHLDHLQTTNFVPSMPIKSKKELKQEEKDRKAQQKADEKERAAQLKAEEKERVKKRNEATIRRMEAWKKQDEDLKAALEASKASAAEEAKTRGVDPPKEGGLARFTRHSSMSLKGKPKIFGLSTKEKEGDRLPLVPQQGENDSVPLLPQEQAQQQQQQPQGQGQGQGPPPTTAALKENESKKNRFSLGRKRSTNIH